MYLDTLAPGTVSPPVLLGEPQDDANINIYILGLTKYTVTYVPGFVTVFLYALTMFIFRITRIISRGKWFNHVSLSCLENVQNLGRSDDGKQRKKKGLTLLVNNTSVCMWTTPPLSVSHQTFLFIYQVTISCITLRVFFLESLHTPFWGCDYISCISYLICYRMISLQLLLDEYIFIAKLHSSGTTVALCLT